MNNQELVQEQHGTAPLRERVNDALDRAGFPTRASAPNIVDRAIGYAK